MWKTVSWGNFVNLLDYKCGWYGKELVKGGETHDRYINASKNILKEGLKIYGKGLAITKVERKSDFSDKADSIKPETH